MLAKVIVRGSDRADALTKLHAALSEAEIFGIETNLSYLHQICHSRDFTTGGVTTVFLKTFRYHRRAIDVIEPGTQTTVQDYPGRLGYWHVGVPPSGPMDPLAFRIANCLAGNTESAAALECTMTGPALRFHSNALIAITGADMHPRLDGKLIPMWQPVEVGSGSTLRFSAATEGSRTYIA